MPRPQTARKIGNTPHENIREGLKLIRNGESMRKASKRANVPFATLKRYFWKTKDSPSLEELLPSQLQPNYSVNRIFTAEQETVLKNYFTHCALLFYGLTAKESRRVAYQSAKINNLKMPASWEEKEMAGKDWLISFRRRHNITLKKPEACSLARATAFNKSNVSIFFDNLENLISRSPNFADGTRIFNLDETSTTTVQKPQKVLAPIGRKTIGKVTSGERGTLITTCCIVSASGNFLPPVMIFPRKNFKDHMIKNTPPGTLGLATPTGWMNTAIFPEVIKHFIKHTNTTKENPCILIMDNHESHLSLEALDLAKTAGVHILTLPPHTSAKLQPLDVGIYGPFKTFYNAAIDSWMLRNPGKPVTIYDLGEIIGSAFQKAMTPRNITNSFAKCGIYPFDRHIFTDEDFLPSSVTDRPNPEDLRDEGASTPDSISLLEGFARAITPEISSDGPSVSIAFIENPGQKTSDASKQLNETSAIQADDSSQCTPREQHILEGVTDVANEPESTLENMLINIETPSTSTAKPTFKSPFEFRDPIKAGPRKTNGKRRKPGRSLIPTDTPEKTMIEQEKNMIKRRSEAKKRKISRTILDSEDEIEKHDEVVLADSDDDSCWLESPEEDINADDEMVITEEDLTIPLPHSPKEGEYVIVELTTKKQRSLYIGKVLEERNSDLEYYISFLKRKPGTNKFLMPNKPDLSLIREDDLKYILPRPSMVGTATRPLYKFPIDFTFLKIY